MGSYTAQCNLAHLKKKEDRKIFWLFGDFPVPYTFVMLFRTTRHVVGQEKLKDELYIVI